MFCVILSVIHSALEHYNIMCFFGKNERSLLLHARRPFRLQTQQNDGRLTQKQKKICVVCGKTSLPLPHTVCCSCVRNYLNNQQAARAFKLSSISLIDSFLQCGSVKRTYMHTMIGGLPRRCYANWKFILSLCLCQFQQIICAYSNLSEKK